MKPAIQAFKTFSFYFLLVVVKVYVLAVNCDVLVLFYIIHFGFNVWFGYKTSFRIIVLSFNNIICWSVVCPCFFKENQVLDIFQVFVFFHWFIQFLIVGAILSLLYMYDVLKSIVYYLDTCILLLFQFWDRKLFTPCLFF